MRGLLKPARLCYRPNGEDKVALGRRGERRGKKLDRRAGNETERLEAKRSEHPMSDPDRAR